MLEEILLVKILEFFFNRPSWLQLNIGLFFKSVSGGGLDYSAGCHNDASGSGSVDLHAKGKSQQLI